MSGKVVNLKTARKARARTEKAARGDANAAKFGRTKADKAQAEALQKLAQRRLDGHERE
ncbi:DUF4169 family protein [Jannaschia sp. M317]|uniref:DUF4169 family protein n=1 Tax=Jannaschia sp. M317 TaxID=2867011 RepID=UPI0021A92D32|nr:DUF4169 family protein [Jannaschia sp. M317]UWQ16912.1 DUF4169 family protein [Jannaschia sp. M317]